MNLNDLTIGQAKELAALFAGANPALASIGNGAPYEIGKNYFIRTVTHHLTGRLVEVHQQELVLVDAAWIADDGRLSDALKSGNFSEIEPYADDLRIIVGRSSIIDAQVFSHKLPRSQK